MEFVYKYMVCSGPDENCPLIYRMTLVNMGKQKKQGYTETLELTWVHRIYRGIQSIQYYYIQGIQYHEGKHGYTGYIGVHKV